MSQTGPDDEIRSLIEAFDHHSAAFANRRQAFYAALHETSCPVLRTSKHEGFTYFGGYDDVLEIQSKADLFSNAQPTIPDRPFPAIIPAKQDPPDHWHYKRLLTPYFTAKAIAARSARIAEVARTLLDPAIEAGAFDMVADVMQPLVAILTAEMLGLDAEQARKYAAPLHNASLAHYPREKAEEEIEWLLHEIAQDVARWRRGDAQGLLAELAAADFQGRKLTDEELKLITVNLLIGGLGTTPIFMGSVTVFLARNPDHRQQLIDNPDLKSTAIEEMVRAFGPVQTFGRVAKQTCPIGATTVQEGDHVLLGYGAANHDPKMFEHPETLDFARSPNRHMSFGIGPHRCLGSHMASSIVIAVLDILLARAPTYRIVEDKLGAYADISTKLGYYSVPISVR